MNKLSLCDSLVRPALALVPMIIAALFGGVSRSLGIKSFQVEPTGGDVNAATVAVASSIKPTGTPGSIAVELLQNKPSALVDQKIIVLRETKDAPPRIIMVPATTASSVALAGETKVAEIERDDITSETSEHTVIEEDGFAEDAVFVAATVVSNTVKPRRNLSSLINAVLDALEKEEEVTTGVALVFDQSGDGKVEVYKGAAITVGDISTKTADVTMSAPTEETTPTIW